ncbi:pyridoxamine 5'-phosphate oxidase family protein [Plastoroseomonas arctica]|uniref:Pyridoxamine 5'-phosphate oxidase n=1 Tax=Plastoroseomonas arctica TaxID=1509237 RepID=A0AAF1KMR5_9PROT|nr:pyridoxamine 5'-phosphate oxidase [Plastoroseomonas arctica]
MTRPRPGFADDLDETLAEAFRLLARGVADRRSPIHTPSLASIGPDGAPRIRTLVLRGFDAPTRTLRVHSDRRSGKAMEIAADPRVAVHAYDAGAQVQLRLGGTATLHAEDAIADAAWATSTDNARLVYTTALPPGAAIPTPTLPSALSDGREHFAVLVLRFDALEWLWLCADGHRRARFGWDSAGQASAEWCVP